MVTQRRKVRKKAIKYGISPFKDGNGHFMGTICLLVFVSHSFIIVMNYRWRLI